MKGRKEILQLLTDTLAINGIKRASIFGSFARDEVSYNDIDILIETNKHSFFDVLKLEEDLKNITGINVDLVEFDALKNSIRDEVLKEAIPIL